MSKYLRLDEIKGEVRVDCSDLMISINGIDVICCDGVGGTFFSVFVEKEDAKELRRLGFKTKPGQKIDHSHNRKRVLKAELLDMEGHTDRD
jgi:hypothetical protein